MSNDAKVDLDLPTGIENIDITVAYTSKPYPVVVRDALRLQGSLSGIRGAPSHTDALGTAGALDGISLRPILQTYDDGDPEAVDSQGSLDGIELDTVLVQYEDGDPEAVEPQGVLSGILLQPQLVTYSNGDPEAVEPQGSLDGIELS